MGNNFVEWFFIYVVMQNIVVIYGGQSPEHDVSILTGLHLAKHITEDYKVTLVYLTKENHFVCGTRNINAYINGRAVKAKPFKDWSKFACVVNCCHGGVGENGALAAMMQIYNLPFTSCDPVSAWQQQSKIQTRQMLTMAGFLQPKFQIVRSLDLDKIKLPLPLVVKPEMLGSSIGVAVAHTKEELFEAVKTALQMGERVIVEEYIADMKEVNIAVMRRHGEIITSGLELVASQKFFSFEEKYFNTESGFIKKSGTSPDADFLQKVTPKIQELAVKAYQLFNAQGVVRVDFMIKGEQIILNELNTVPGFMAYHLWLKCGVPYGVVIDDMIKEAISQQKKQQFITHFDSDILQKNRQLVVEI